MSWVRREERAEGSSMRGMWVSRRVRRAERDWWAKVMRRVGGGGEEEEEEEEGGGGWTLGLELELGRGGGGGIESCCFW